MRTVNEVMRDVLANPEEYEHAFPVSAPEVLVAFDIETHGVRWSTFPDLNAPGADLSGARLSPEAMELARQRMLSSSYSREPRGMQWPPATVDFMRRMLEERSPLMSGTWSDGETRFVRDESVPRDRVTMVGVPLREDSWAARMINQERRLDQRYFGDGSGFLAWREADLLARPTVWEDLTREAAQQMINMTAIDDPSMGTAQNYAGDGEAVPDMARLANMQDSLNRSEEVIRRHLEQSATPPRPDHYRVSSGRCACGFTSMFDGDMDHHVRGIVHDCDGVPRRWWLCECGASALCREVVTMRPGPVGGWSDHTPYPPTPITEHIYLCDACCQRRGIR